MPLLPATHPMVSAIVLAAGESLRMGPHNKLLLPFAGRPLIAHVAETVAASDADEVIVVLGHQADRVREALHGYDVAFRLNPRYAEGMTTSIQAGVRAASAETAGLMICLSDLPTITPAELNLLTAAFREAVRRDPRCIVRPVYQGQRGNPVLFSAPYKPALLAHREPTGCQALVRQNATRVVEVEMPTDHVLRDVDTPAAYQALASPDARRDS